MQKRIVATRRLISVCCVLKSPVPGSMLLEPLQCVLRFNPFPPVQSLPHPRRIPFEDPNDFYHVFSLNSLQPASSEFPRPAFALHQVCSHLPLSFLCAPRKHFSVSSFLVPTVFCQLASSFLQFACSVCQFPRRFHPNFV